MTDVKPTVTPLYRLDAQIGWRASPHSVNVMQDPLLQQLRLGRPGDFPIAANEPFGTFGGLTLPRGITISPEGAVLLADPANNRILFFANRACDSQGAADDSVPAPFRLLWKTPERARPGHAHAHDLFKSEPQVIDFYNLNQPKDVLFLTGNKLAVADTGHQRIIIYSWPTLRVLHQVTEPGSAPTALLEDAEHGLLVADSGLHRLSRFNRLWQKDTDYLGGEGQLQAPVAMALVDDGQVLVLDRTGVITKLSAQGAVREANLDAEQVFFHNIVTPPLHYHEGTLSYPQQAKPACEPLYLGEVEMDRQGYLRGTLLPLLARPRSIRLPRQGTYISNQLDSQQLSSQWHRVVLSADLPSAARILVSTHTGDRAMDEAEVPELKWSTPTLISTDAPNDRPELLIQSEPGRYLRLRVELLGDGFSSPVIRNIQVFGPRDSSLRFLPPPFKHDPESAHFLDRLLSYFDTVREEAHFLIRDFTRYLDPKSVPPGPFLDWLGSWFDWRFLAQWPTELRREMISQSILFFRMRGTLAGVKQMLQWHTGLTGDQPQLIEHFRLRNYADLQRTGVAAAPLYVGELPLQPTADQIAHWFTVVLPSSAVHDKDALEQIRQLIEVQKPAHTAFQLRIFHPGVRIGKQSSIGLDTWVGHYPRGPLGEFSLGQSSTSAAGNPRGLRVGQQLLMN